MDWRLVVARNAPAGGSGAWNMAVDEALLESVARGGAPVLRLYGWSPSCVSFGRNQPARGLFDTGLAREHGIDLVRRPTGGLAVHHHREITYAVAAPVGCLGGPRETYRQINLALLHGLRRLGVPATLSEGVRANGASVAARNPCFQRAARGEVVVGGRKLVGSAQRCEQRTILQHGSILLEGDQSAVLLLQRLPWQGDDGSITLREALGRTPDHDTVIAAVVAGFEARCGTRLAPTQLTPHEDERARCHELRYRSLAWTWRR